MSTGGWSIFKIQKMWRKTWSVLRSRFHLASSSFIWCGENFGRRQWKAFSEIVFSLCFLFSTISFHLCSAKSLGLPRTGNDYLIYIKAHDDNRHARWNTMLTTINMPSSHYCKWRKAKETQKFAVHIGKMSFGCRPGFCVHKIRLFV